MLAVVGVRVRRDIGLAAFRQAYMMRKFIQVGVIPPQTVSTARPKFAEWQGEFQAVGTLRRGARRGHCVEVPGTIVAIQFQCRAGDRGGTPLVQLNNESDLARLAVARGGAESPKSTISATGSSSRSRREPGRSWTPTPRT